jgi:ubiquinone/menaquinone biosynthesis C-methylase UbiE
MRRNFIQQMLGPVRGMVLDVAGPGMYGHRVAGPSTKVYGIDISEGMLWQGVEYLRREGVGNVG